MPLLLQLTTASKHVSRFTFQNMWTDHHDFKHKVDTIWNCQVTDPPGVRFYKKRSILRKELKSWNWQVFGNLTNNIANLQTQISSMENQLQTCWDEAVFESCQKAKSDLVQNVKWESDLLMQKARMKWMDEGDRNSKFFHAAIKERRKRKTINLKLADGSYSSDGEVSGEKAVEYF